VNKGTYSKKLEYNLRPYPHGYGLFVLSYGNVSPVRVDALQHEHHIGVAGRPATINTSAAIEVQRRPFCRIVYFTDNVGPASEDLPLTITNGDVELETYYPNCM
jgi:hypothetical protein